MAEAKKPKNKFRAGNITSTIWANENKNKKGETFETLSFTLERSYKDKDDKWNNTTSMRVEDIAKIEIVLRQTAEYCLIKQDVKEDE
jgi:hypothetical protein